MNPPLCAAIPTVPSPRASSPLPGLQPLPLLSCRLSCQLPGPRWHLCHPWESQPHPRLAPGSSPPLKPGPHLPSGGPHCHFPSRPVLHGMKLYITSISSAVTTTDHHKPGDLKRQEVLSGSWGWKVELRLPEGQLAGRVPPLTLWCPWRP